MGKLTNKIFIYVTLIAIANFSEIEVAWIRSLLMMCRQEFPGGLSAKSVKQPVVSVDGF